MQLPKLLEILDRQFIARQMQQCVDQHRPMTIREHEAIAIRPVGVGGVVAHQPIPEHLRDIGHAHGRAGVAAFGGLDGVHGKRHEWR